MRPLITAQNQPNNDILLTCTICGERAIIFVATFDKKEQNKQMAKFNTDHAKAHKDEPGIATRVIKTQQ